MVWASFAVAPLKRFVIEFPFVAEKVIPSLPSKGNGLTNAVHQKYRLSSRSRVPRSGRFTPSLLASAGGSLWYLTSG
jgi:hypothetical protein